MLTIRSHLNPIDPSRLAHFRKLYWNKNWLKFLISYFFLAPRKHFWGTTKKSENKILSQVFCSSWVKTGRVKHGLFRVQVDLSPSLWLGYATTRKFGSVVVHHDSFWKYIPISSQVLMILLTSWFFLQK